MYRFRDAGHTALWTPAGGYNEVVRAFLARQARGETAGSAPLAAASTIGA